MSELNREGRPREAMSRNTTASISGAADALLRGAGVGAGADFAPCNALPRRRPLLERRRKLELSERLAEEIIHAGREAAFAITLHGIRRERDDGDPGAARPPLAPPDFRGCRQSVHDGHLAIHQHGGVACFAHGFEGQHAVRGGLRSIAQVLEHSNRDLAVDRVVLDQQNQGPGARRHVVLSACPATTSCSPP